MIVIFFSVPDRLKGEAYCNLGEFCTEMDFSDDDYDLKKSGGPLGPDIKLEALWAS